MERLFTTFIYCKGIKLEKLSYEIANWKRAQAKNRMEQMIRQYGNTIDNVDPYLETNEGNTTP